MTRWYVCQDGLVTGPYDQHAIIAGLRSGARRDVLLAEEGGTAWVPLDLLPLFSAIEASSQQNPGNAQPLETATHLSHEPTEAPGGKIRGSTQVRCSTMIGDALVRSKVSSLNGEFALGWVKERSGHLSPIVLFRNGAPAFVGKATHPRGGAVADTGVFAIHEDIGVDSLRSMVCVFDKAGKALYKHRFGALIDSVGIAPDGSAVVVQLCSAESNDGDTLQLLDVINKRVAWITVPETGRPRGYRFDFERRRLILSYETSTFCYALDTGRFLEADRWEKERIQYTNGFGLLQIVKDKFSGRGRRATANELDEADRLITLAIARDLHKYPYQEAEACRFLGELYESTGASGKAFL